MSDFTIRDSDSDTSPIKVHVWTGDNDDEMHIATPPIGAELTLEQAMQLGKKLISTSVRVSQNRLIIRPSAKKSISPGTGEGTPSHSHPVSPDGSGGHTGP